MKQVIGGEDLINSFISLRDSCDNGYFHYSYGKRDALLIFSPEIVNEVLVNKQNSFSRGIVFLKMKNFFGNGLIVSEDPEHITNKRMLQGSFSKKIVDDYQTIINNECNASFENLEEKGFSLSNLADKVAFDCVAKCFIGEDVPSEYISAYHDISYKISNIPRLVFSTEETINFSPVRNFIKDIILQSNVQDNLLWSMINSDMNTDQITDEIITILGAGFETTSALISWTLINLYNNDDVLQKCREDDSMIDKAIKETLRTNPPAYFTTRTASNDIDLSGVTIKQGTNIFISQYVTHRDKKYYSDPDNWNPERWSKQFEKSLPRGAYFPFGMGSKKCIGEYFSIMVAKTFISLFINRYHFEIIDKNIKPKYLVSMIPDSPVTTITSSLFDK
jgi:cytochrome P450